MNVYKTSQVRNVVFLGHGGAGKTTLAEAMAYATGVITRMGSVDNGNTISDYDSEEIKRKFSINAAVIPIEWNGLKINILDAPGYFDFVGQTEDAMSVADAAVIVVNGKAGLEVGTIKALNGERVAPVSRRMTARIRVTKAAAPATSAKTAP